MAAPTGVQRCVEMLVEEFGVAFAIMGYPHAADLDRSALLPAPWPGWAGTDT